MNFLCFLKFFCLSLFQFSYHCAHASGKLLFNGWRDFPTEASKIFLKGGAGPGPIPGLPTIDYQCYRFDSMSAQCDGQIFASTIIFKHFSI